MAIKSTNYICHLHFKEEHVQMYKKFIINGDLKVFPLGKKMLLDEAIPTIHHQFRRSEPQMPNSYQIHYENEQQQQERQYNAQLEPLEASFNNAEQSEPQMPNSYQIHYENEQQQQERQHKEQLESLEASFINTEELLLTVNDDEITQLSIITQQSVDAFQNYILKLFTMLPPYWMYNKNSNGVEFMRIDPINKIIKNHIRFNQDLSITVIFRNNEELILSEKIHSYGNTYDYLKSVEKWPLCIGTEMDDNKYSKNCKGVIVGDDTYKRNQSNARCKACRILRKRLQDRHSTPAILDKTTAIKRRASALFKQCKRLKRTKIQLSEKVLMAKSECAKKSDVVVQEAILKLPKEFHNNVNACFDAAKKKNSKGRRYTLEWIYECLLIRLKSRNTYEFIRYRNILPLPSIETLNKFIRKISSSAYGFQTATFYSLKERCESMKNEEKRGVILVDEMKLSEGVYFDRQSMKFNGFVDLGQHTPENLTNVTADHALVFKYVPFRGRWVQALGCFLSKNSCKSEPLHKLILECIVLMENSGICVDAVVMDGAPWNRGVWTIFGINENNISCEHPYDSSRRLWMISDFNHLLKCFRSSTLDDKVREFKTPFGIVKKKHWEAVLAEENYRQLNLKIAYKLTPTHLKPKGYQTMNVPLATQVFDHQVSVAMAHYEPVCKDLQDSTPTQKFIDLVYNLIQAMSSRIPRDALYVKENCRQRKAILEFLNFLGEWERLEKKIPISKSTLLGLKVTLRAAFEILDMLKLTCQYKYLMTANLSQDPLERFFSVMRYSCGGNDHPDPKMFAQVYRLASSFSLIRPPKGCNIPGEDLLRNMIGAKELSISSHEDRKLWLENLDNILENNEPLLEKSPTDADHDYNEAVTSDAVQSYIAGYLVRKLRKTVKCVPCLDTIQISPENGKKMQRNDVIVKMDLYGGLIFASDQLFNLTKQLEKCVLRACSKSLTNLQTINKVSAELKKEVLLRVGCVEHESHLTKYVIDIYIVMRAHFLAKSENKRYDAAKIKTKMNRKNAKLLS